MKKTAISLMLAALALASCKNTTATVDVRAAIEAMDSAASAIEADSTLTAGEKFDRSLALYDSVYAAHPHDSIGLAAFTNAAAVYWDADTFQKRIADADTLITGNRRVQRYSLLKQAEAVTAPGQPYIDITGTDPLTGETKSLSGYLALGKPVLVDFWAAWCPDCRKEISTILPGIDREKYTLVSVAVWGRGEDKTVQAISDLAMDWPVISTGGRENSPADSYGITCIPTYVLISPDGTILNRGIVVSRVIE